MVPRVLTRQLELNRKANTSAAAEGSCVAIGTIITISMVSLVQERAVWKEGGVATATIRESVTLTVLTLTLTITLLLLLLLLTMVSVLLVLVSVLLGVLMKVIVESVRAGVFVAPAVVCVVPKTK